MKKLVIDSTSLRRLAEELAIIAAEFVVEDANAAELAIAVGEPKLGGAVVEFAADWQRKRKDFVDDITDLLQGLRGAADAFEDADSSLARFLEHGAGGLTPSIDWKITE